MNGKLDSQLVIQMIERTWDKQMETYASQPDGLLKEAGGYDYISPLSLRLFPHLVSASMRRRRFYFDRVSGVWRCPLSSFFLRHIQTAPEPLKI
jgi:hypothetical protein